MDFLIKLVFSQAKGIKANNNSKISSSVRKCVITKTKTQHRTLTIYQTKDTRPKPPGSHTI